MESATRAKLIGPLPGIWLVTSYIVQAPVPTKPVSPTTAPVAGRFIQVMAVSDHDVSSTRTSFGPSDEPFSDQNFRVAEVT